MATVDNSNNNNSLYHLPPPSPIDAGIIRCICSSTEDDGFTIQCEKCLVWQHAFCVQINQFNIPDQYLCDVCSKKKRPKLSKRIQISKKKLKILDNDEEPSSLKQLQTTGRTLKNRIVSRHVYSIFKEAKERWARRSETNSAFVSMDSLLYNSSTTLVTNSNTKKKNGIYALKPINNNRYMMQVTGDILLKSEYKFDPPNDFCYLGTPQSHVLFYPNLDLCMDTRQFGNKARYLRRSCHPNADLRNILVQNSSEIHLGLFSKHAIEKGEEITVGWGWQKGHIAWKENIEYHRRRLDDNKVIDEEEERKKKFTIRNMLDRFEKEFGACACLNKRRCLIEQMKIQCQDIVLPRNEKTQAAKIRRRRSKVNSYKYQQNNTNLDSMEENVDVDVMSNSPPTLNPVKINGKSTPDDEDEEDIIDIGDDDLPAIPPLKDQEEEDEEVEEGGDLLSLSSLSSLSEDEQQQQQQQQHDSEHRIKRKKLTKEQEVRKKPAPLPRKKLWVKNYLKNHAILQQQQQQQQEQDEQQINDSNVNNNNKENANNDEQSNNNTTTMITKNEIVLYTKPQQENDDDDDDGELSDASEASTVLMDQDELSQVYNHAITQE
ncbi:SET domain-containing protein [Backusella circina FSU 941]|nr:SET domain-containing protein [Backusella circina FSU 941]